MNVEYWVIAVVVLGSVVDIMQFVWITKRLYSKLKRKLYHHIKRQILEDYNKHERK